MSSKLHILSVIDTDKETNTKQIYFSDDFADTLLADFIDGDIISWTVDRSNHQLTGTLIGNRSNLLLNKESHTND